MQAGVRSARILWGIITTVTPRHASLWSVSAPWGGGYLHCFTAYILTCWWCGLTVPRVRIRTGFSWLGWISLFPDRAGCTFWNLGQKLLIGCSSSAVQYRPQTRVSSSLQTRQNLHQPRGKPDRMFSLDKVAVLELDLPGIPPHQPGLILTQLELELGLSRVNFNETIWGELWWWCFQPRLH